MGGMYIKPKLVEDEGNVTTVKLILLANTAKV